MTIRTILLFIPLTIVAATAQDRPVTINPIGDGSFHTVTGSDSTTHTIYTPDRGQTFGGANAAGGGYQGTGVYSPASGSISTPGTSVPVPVPPVH
jgi:hypothetical protein